MRDFNRPGVTSGGSWRREIVNKAKGYSIEEKATILQKAMYRAQPTFDDFRGCPGYSNDMLGRDAQKLKEKEARIARNNKGKSGEAWSDRWSVQAEPILTYVMNTDSFLSTRDSFAFLAHEYDDKYNGTDIVFCVMGKDKRYMTFSVDVATGTSSDNIRKKFDESAQSHGGTPPMAAYVKYCVHGGRHWKESEAPQFILGMMPSRLDDATGAVDIKEGLIAGREADPKTDFKLLSEMREQIIMQLAILKNEKNPANESRMNKLRELISAVNTRLAEICGVKGDTNEERIADYGRKYKKMMGQMREDLVYKNIVDEAIRRTNMARGKKVRNAA